MSEKKTVIQEFVEFISRGNVIDLAVGVIIGGAFTAVVTALVTNIIQPLIAFLTGSVGGVGGLTLNLNGNIVDFSAFISAIINFLLTALAVFFIVKTINAFHKMKEKGLALAGIAKKAADSEAAAAAPHCPYCKQEIAVDATRCPHCTSKLTGYNNPAEHSA
ncbi:large conductance mechanosensitive channel protein MscL [Collinsella sp. zg1085]|uniref:large conductance mechanosensitive channel protein MscL n=1 Tax=Collinsella sp. zg1085 TaxID=2844380 RepID=UPI001C0CE429|nr:large conductance mechanosensitive channel protein MscL [Collinsella sp. zg1085]QWT18196.1 large conductance mechanosensitive channel protein MscL [Collinsella sp. zg1085]